MYFTSLSMLFNSSIVISILLTIVISILFIYLFNYGKYLLISQILYYYNAKNVYNELLILHVHNLQIVAELFENIVLAKNKA